MAEKLGAGAAVHEAAPARASKPAKPKGERPAVAGHNEDEERAQERAIREAMQSKLIGLNSKHREVDNKIAVLKAQIDEVNGDRKEIRTAIGNIVRLDLFDESYNELRLRTPKIDLEDKERQRDLIREAFGLPRGVGGQGDLLKDVARQKTAEDWEADGYRAGIAGDDPDFPDGMPPQNGQDFMRGYHQATARNAAGIKTLDAEIPPSSEAQTPLEEAAAAPPPEDEKQEGDDELVGVAGRKAGAAAAPTSELMD